MRWAREREKEREKRFYGPVETKSISLHISLTLSDSNTHCQWIVRNSRIALLPKTTYWVWTKTDMFSPLSHLLLLLAHLMWPASGACNWMLARASIKWWNQDPNWSCWWWWGVGEIRFPNWPPSKTSSRDTQCESTQFTCKLHTGAFYLFEYLL